MVIEFTFPKVNIFNDFGDEQFLLFSNFIENKFEPPGHRSTIGIEFMRKTVEFEKGRLARLSLWVMGGQDRFRYLLRNYLEGTHGILIMCDITREREIIEIDTWLKNILSYREYLIRKVTTILVGYITNDKKPKIPHEELRNLAKSYELDGYKICNLQTGENIEEILEALTRDMINLN
ncbi:MAG: ADP-ribosylation factor-like protein, partial [Candidatus Hodarchaeota archaeon]